MLHYTSTTLGTITVVQQRPDEEKPRKFKIQIRRGNCLAVFLHVYKEKEPQDPKRPWVHQLAGYLADEKALKYNVKELKTNVFAYFFMAKKIEKARLNLYYAESKTLLKYMVRDGLKVECYYKKD